MIGEKEFDAVTKRIRENLLDEFDQLKNQKDTDSLTESDLDFNLARDRKAALILKTLQMEMQHETLKLRNGKSVKRLDNKKGE